MRLSSGPSCAVASFLDPAVYVPLPTEPYSSRLTSKSHSNSGYVRGESRQHAQVAEAEGGVGVSLACYPLGAYHSCIRVETTFNTEQTLRTFWLKKLPALLLPSACCSRALGITPASCTSTLYWSYGCHYVHNPIAGADAKETICPCKTHFHCIR